MATEPMDTTTNSSAPPTATATTSSSQSQSQNKKQKRTHSESSATTTKPTTLKSLTIRSPPWSYIHLQQLQHSTPSNLTPLDPLTCHLHISHALHSFLGLHGSAVPVDILKLDSDSGADSVGRGELWIRVPAQDRSAVLAAVGGWVGKGGEGWRVLGWSSWGIGKSEGGRELFG